MDDYVFDIYDEGLSFTQTWWNPRTGETRYGATNPFPELAASGRNQNQGSDLLGKYGIYILGGMMILLLATRK